MKKAIIILCLLCGSFASYAQLIQNVNFQLADESEQEIGEPYKFNISFDTENENLVEGAFYWQLFITTSDDDSFFRYWNTKYQGYSIGTNDYTSIVGGVYHYEFPFSVNMKDYYPNFPVGEYKIAIMAYIGGGVFVVVNYNHEESVTYFTMNDICPTCPDVYEGHDDDGDGVLELNDNCPDNFNPLQENDDDDSIGNVCDNCPSTTNENQADQDNDGIGDVCDSDIDGDGILNGQDSCPYEVGTISNNGCPSVDSDGDGVFDNHDACPYETGPASNNGCPEVFADLVVNTTLSTARSSAGTSTVVAFSNNQTHHIYLGQELQINLSIKNQGDATSGNNVVGVYLSSNNNFANAALIDQINYNSSIAENQSVSRYFTLSNSALSAYSDAYGSVYVHFKLDKNNDVNEGDDGGENNNVYSSVRAKTYYTNGRPFPKKIISLNNFTSTTVNNENEQKTVIDKLENGLYVIKNNNGDTQKIIKY